ncbi:MAG: IS982 family transposase [Methylovulum sp.]|nr:MAG: IS982 family transposase [Methylovulum sp.]
MPVEDFIIYVYCCVEETYRELVKEPLRRRGFQPKLTDSEVITMEIVGEFMGKDQDKSLWRYFRNHWHAWFPNLGSRSSFVKQSANLWALKELIQNHLARQMGALNDPVHLVDGFPMPVCKITRVAQSRCFNGEAGYGYCASKDEKYYGFEGHVVVNDEGIICGYTFAAATIDERDVLQDMTEGLKGLLIGDKGFIRPLLKEELVRQQIDLQTPLRKNMTDPRPKPVVKRLMTVRRLVETVISQLAERFHVERVHARDLWHLTNRFIRKLLAHTIGVFLNKLLGNPPLHFDALVEA